MRPFGVNRYFIPHWGAFVLFHNMQNALYSPQTINAVVDQSIKNATMTSVQIATITGKRHKNVMQSIRNMEPAWEKINGLKFQLAEYTDKKGEKRPCYQLTKTECLYIATKFNDEARAKLILRWEQLEYERQPKVPTTMYEALIFAAAQAKMIEQKDATIEQQNQRLDESEQWFSIKRWAKEHNRDWRTYNWRKLKAVSYELGYPPKKTFDANYGEVNLYHKTVFRAVYP